MGLVLAHEHLFNLFREGLTIVDNLTGPLIYNIQLLDSELTLRLREGMIAYIVWLIRSSREGIEHSGALRGRRCRCGCDETNPYGRRYESDMDTGILKRQIQKSRQTRSV